MNPVLAQVVAWWNAQRQAFRDSTGADHGPDPGDLFRWMAERGLRSHSGYSLNPRGIDAHVYRHLMSITNTPDAWPELGRFERRMAAWGPYPPSIIEYFNDCRRYIWSGMENPYKAIQFVPDWLRDESRDGLGFRGCALLDYPTFASFIERENLTPEEGAALYYEANFHEPGAILTPDLRIIWADETRPEPQYPIITFIDCESGEALRGTLQDPEFRRRWEYCRARERASAEPVPVPVPAPPPVEVGPPDLDPTLDHDGDGLPDDLIPEVPLLPPPPEEEQPEDEDDLVWIDIPVEPPAGGWPDEPAEPGDIPVFVPLPAPVPGPTPGLPPQGPAGPGGPEPGRLPINGRAAGIGLLLLAVVAGMASRGGRK